MAGPKDCGAAGLGATGLRGSERSEGVSARVSERPPSDL